MKIAGLLILLLSVIWVVPADSGVVRCGMTGEPGCGCGHCCEESPCCTEIPDPPEAKAAGAPALSLDFCLSWIPVFISEPANPSIQPGLATYYLNLHPPPLYRLNTTLLI